MKKKYVMALDQGTTSSRCILYDRSGQQISMKDGSNTIPWRYGPLR